MSAALLSSLGDDDIDQLGSGSWDEVLDVQLDHENENYGWRFPFFFVMVHKVTLALHNLHHCLCSDRCVAHIMHLAILDIIGRNGTGPVVFKNLVQNLHKICSTIQHSANLRSDLLTGLFFLFIFLIINALL